MSPDFWGAPPTAEPSATGDEPTPSAIDERGAPPLDIGGGGLRRELEAMYALIQSDARTRLRWLSR